MCVCVCEGVWWGVAHKSHINLKWQHRFTVFRGRVIKFTRATATWSKMREQEKEIKRQRVREKARYEEQQLLQATHDDRPKWQLVGLWGSPKSWSFTFAHTPTRLVKYVYVCVEQRLIGPTIYVYRYRYMYVCISIYTSVYMYIYICIRVRNCSVELLYEIMQWGLF